MKAFQYGVDFGLIAGIQAMVGFDEVSRFSTSKGISDNGCADSSSQVFGHKDPLSPTGWNLSPVTQQLISSLMTIGAVLGCGFAGA